jgi:predicted TIM-barrel fold metal-dependent hydrolase
MSIEANPFRGFTHRTLSQLSHWQSDEDEAALEPDLPIVDAHHHLWDDRRGRYLLDDFLADNRGGHSILGTVFVQCHTMYDEDATDAESRITGETIFARGCAAMSASGVYGPARVVNRIVAFADLSAGDMAARVLDAQIEAGGGRVSGIRQPAAWDGGSVGRFVTPPAPPRGLLCSTAFRQGFVHLARRNLSFDAWLFHPQLEDVLDLADRFPGTRIIIDHAGGPTHVGPYCGRHEEVFAAWRTLMQKLALRDNVSVKIGGLGMLHLGFDLHLASRPPASEDVARAWKPYVETVIDTFGPERCLFESNFPVDKQTCSYTVLWNAFKRLTGDMSPAERDMMFWGNAIRLYKMALPQSSSKQEPRS